MSEEITQIKQLLANYCHRVDRGTPDEVAALFAVDAVLRPRFDGKYDVHGRAAIRGWFEHYNKHVRAGVRHMKHMISSIAIEVSGNTATATCYLTVSSISNSDDKAGIVYGIYTDRLVKVDGIWLFADRIIETQFVAYGLHALEEMPSMGYPPALP